MILYDSTRPLSILKFRGSIFPRAVVYALPATFVAILVKYLERLEVGLPGIAVSKTTASSSVYSGFTFVLGFVLIFRASQSYNRYWLAATSVHLMQAEWLTACSTLVAFSKISKKRREEVMNFVHTFLRLFALMHALALEDVADLEDFPLLDIKGFAQDDLLVLSDGTHEGRKVELVFQWIQAHIIKGVDTGLMNAPPPLLTRVFQNLGNGLVNYYSAQQVVIWPFPFAYAQMNSVLVWVYAMVTPFVTAGWATAEWNCGLFTFVSVVCMIGLDLISTELENPFGNDPNDLPVHEMQNIFIQDLIMLIDPKAWRVPKLQTGHRSYHAMVRDSRSDVNISLRKYCSENLEWSQKMVETISKGRWKALSRGTMVWPNIDEMLNNETMSNRSMVMTPDEPAQDTVINVREEKDVGRPIRVIRDSLSMALDCRKQGVAFADSDRCSGVDCCSCECQADEAERDLTPEEDIRFEMDVPEEERMSGLESEGFRSPRSPGRSPGRSARADSAFQAKVLGELRRAKSGGNPPTLQFATESTYSGEIASSVPSVTRSRSPSAARDRSPSLPRALESRSGLYLMDYVRSGTR